MHGRHKADLRALSLFMFVDMNRIFCHRPVTLHTAAATLSSLASLSLVGSPPPQATPQTGTSFTSASGILASGPVPKVEAKDDDVVLDEASAASAVAPVKAEINGAGIGVTKTGKKRGTIFKCESCSKVSTLLLTHGYCTRARSSVWSIRPQSFSEFSCVEQDQNS